MWSDCQREDFVRIVRAWMDANQVDQSTMSALMVDCLRSINPLHPVNAKGWKK